MPEEDARDQDPLADAADSDSPLARGARRVARPARRAVDAIKTVAAATEPIVERIGQAVDDVERSLAERPGMRVRRVRRLGATPLPYLNDVHPDVRRAHPVSVGVRTIPVADIGGTAVGGGDQRGGDFLPLKPFRGKNWAARWQRLNRAQNALAILPPIEVVKHAGRYWVVDGHNRVGLALYNAQPEIDADIVELVPPGELRTEPIQTLATEVSASRALRSAVEGHPPGGDHGHDEVLSMRPTDDDT